MTSYDEMIWFEGKAYTFAQLEKWAEEFEREWKQKKAEEKKEGTPNDPE